MPPALKGAAGASVATVTNVPTSVTLTPTLPTHAAGDLLLCYTMCRSGTPTVATPSGWTSLVNIAATNGRIVLFGKIATSAAETNPGCAWSGLTSGNSGSPAMAQCSVWTGMPDTITGITDVLGTVENGAASATASASGNAITTLTDNDLVLALTTRLDDAGSWTAPSGFAGIGWNGTTSGSDMAYGWAYQVKTPAGSVAAADFTLSGGSSFASSGVLIALKARVPVTYFGELSLPITFGKSVSGIIIPTFPSVVVADDFNRPLEGLPAGNWAGTAGKYRVDFNVLNKLASTLDEIYWNVEPSEDHECYVQFGTPITDSRTMQLHVRRNPASDTGYFLQVVPLGGDITCSLQKRVSSVDTSLTLVPGISTINGGDWIGLSIEGNTLYVWYKPSAGSWQLVQSWTDSSITGTGVTSIRHNDVELTLDNWGAPSAGAVTKYGIVSMPMTFGKEVSGTKKTFGQTAMPITFAATTSGSRKVFGQIAFPITFSKQVSGVRKAFGQIAFPITFNKVVAGSKKTFGQIAFPITFGKDVSGSKKTFGQLALPITFGKEVAGSLKAFGQTSLALTFGKDVRGQRKTFGQLVSPFIFGKAVQGQRKTFSQVSLPITATISVAGVRVGNTHFGVVAMPITFGKDVRGVRKAFGAVALPITFGKDVKATRKTFGQITFPIIFAPGVIGKRTAFGALSMQTLFGKETAGRRKTFGQVAFPITFSKSVAGRKQTFGRVVLPINFVAYVNGIAFTGPKTLYGSLSMPITFNKQVTAQRKTFGRVIAPFIFGKDVRGQRKTFSDVDFPMDFLFDVETGKVGAKGQISFPIILNIQTNGVLRPLGTILNYADKVYLGDTPVLAVYVEDQLVWVDT